MSVDLTPLKDEESGIIDPVRDLVGSVENDLVEIDLVEIDSIIWI